MAGDGDIDSLPPVDPNQAFNEKKRLEKEQIEKHKLDFADWMAVKNNKPRSDYRRIDARDKDAEAEDAFVPGLMTIDSASGLLKPGVYEDKNGKYHIRIRDDGTASPLFGFDSKSFFGGPGPLGGAITSKQFEEGYGQVMDALSVGRGAKCIHINWKQGSEKYVNEKYLMKLMNMAAKRGLTVEFGPTVEKYLDNLVGEKGKKARKRIYAAKMALERFQEADKLLSRPGEDNYAFDKWKQELDKTKKLAEPPANLRQKRGQTKEQAIEEHKANTLRNSLYAAGDPIDKKVNKIEEQITDIEARMKTIGAGRKELNSCLDAHQRTLEDPLAFIAKNPVKKRKTRAKIAGAAAAIAAGVTAGGAAFVAAAPTGIGGAVVAATTVGQAAASKAYDSAYKSTIYESSTDKRVDKLFNARVDLTRDPAELVRKVKEQMDASHPNRIQLLNSLDKELNDLVARNKIWKQELTALKTELQAKQTAAPPTITEAEKKLLTEKIPKLEANQEAWEKELRGHRNEVDAIAQKQSNMMNVYQQTLDKVNKPDFGSERKPVVGGTH